MARTLLQEIAHQIFSPIPKKKNKSGKYQNNHKKKPPRDYAYEKMEYNLLKSDFENKKAVEIARYIAKSKGWL